MSVKAQGADGCLGLNREPRRLRNADQAEDLSAAKLASLTSLSRPSHGAFGLFSHGDLKRDESTG